MATIQICCNRLKGEDPDLVRLRGLTAKEARHKIRQKGLTPAIQIKSESVAGLEAQDKSKGKTKERDQRSKKKRCQGNDKRRSSRKRGEELV